MTEESAPDSCPERSRPRGRPAFLVPLLLVLGALGLRLWGIGWSLPNADRYFTYHPDEGVNLLGGALDRGEPRPHLDLGFYNYGSLYFYLWQIVIAINRTYGLIRLPPTDAPSEPTADSIAAMILGGRLLSAILGALTVWVVYALAGRLYGQRAGVFAGVFMAVTPAAVVHSHFATVDATATFFVAVALLCAARLLFSGSPRDAALAGCFCGLAGAAKYNCGLVIVSAITAALLHREHVRLRNLGIVIGAAAIGFLVACPGVFLSWPAFRRDFLFELQKSGEGMGLLFAGTAPGWVYHLTSSLRFGLGMPLLLFMLAGLVWALWRRRPGDMVLLAFFVVYYGVIGAAQVKFLRYIIPLPPVMAALASGLAAEVWDLRHAIRPAMRALAISVAASALFIDLALVGLMSGEDPRDRALAFLRSQAPIGSSIAFARIPWYDVPPLAPGFTLPSPSDRARAAREVTRWRLRIPPMGHELSMEVFTPDPPDWVILSDIATQDWERLQIPAWARFKQILETDYAGRIFERLPSFLGLSAGKPAHTPHDLLYIYPRITVWERREPAQPRR